MEPSVVEEVVTSLVPAKSRATEKTIANTAKTRAAAVADPSPPNL